MGEEEEGEWEDVLMPEVWPESKARVQPPSNLLLVVTPRKIPPLSAPLPPPMPPLPPGLADAAAAVAVVAIDTEWV